MKKKKTTKPTNRKKSTKKTTPKAKATSRPSGSTSKLPIEFSYDAPDAEEVAVTGSFCGWGERVQLEREDSGRWRATVSLRPGDYEYRFLVDGEWRDDPACPERTPNHFGTENCVLHV